MFKVYFYNFGFYSAHIGKDLDEAKEIAKKAGFQSSIYNGNYERVMSYCPLNGFSRNYSAHKSNDSLDYLRPIE